MTTETDSEKKKRKAAARDVKAERLQSALRDNLKKRKQQAQARSRDGAGSSKDSDSGGQ